MNIKRVFSSFLPLFFGLVIFLSYVILPYAAETNLHTLAPSPMGERGEGSLVSEDGYDFAHYAPPRGSSIPSVEEDGEDDEGEPENVNIGATGNTSLFVKMARHDAAPLLMILWFFYRASELVAALEPFFLALFGGVLFLVSHIVVFLFAKKLSSKIVFFPVLAMYILCFLDVGMPMVLSLLPMGMLNAFAFIWLQHAWWHRPISILERSPLRYSLWKKIFIGGITFVAGGIVWNTLPLLFELSKFLLMSTLFDRGINTPKQDFFINWYVVILIFTPLLYLSLRPFHYKKMRLKKKEAGASASELDDLKISFRQESLVHAMLFVYGFSLILFSMIGLHKVGMSLLFSTVNWYLLFRAYFLAYDLFRYTPQNIAKLSGWHLTASNA